MRDQVAALLLLRLQIFSHTFAGVKRYSFLIAAVFMLVVALAGCGLGCLLYFMSSALPVHATQSIFVISAIAVGFFFFFWLFTLLMELQRSESIDFKKMLHFPISLRMVFMLNYAAALFTPGMVLFSLSAAGLIIGLAVSQGMRMFWAFPLAIFFYLMLASWTYYARGILAAIMENKRRRRMVLTIISLAFVTIAQLPNIANHMFFQPTARRIRSEVNGPNKEQALQDESARAYAAGRGIAAAIPIGWLPLGVVGLVEGNRVTFGACLSGMAGLTALGLGLGYRSTWRYYTGYQRARKRRDKPAAQAPTAPTGERGRDGRLWIEKALPFVDDETSAMAMASLLTYLRQPNIYMMLIMPLFFGILFLFGFAQSASRNAAPLAPAIVTIWPVFNFGMLLLNLFGIDREGFRTLVLLPTDRRKFLLGKNLALMPLVLGVSLIFVAIGSIMAHFSILVFVLSLLQVMQLYLLYCIAGNFTSLYFPYRMAWQGLRSVGNRSMTFAATLLALVLIVALSAPTVFFVFLDSLLERYFGYNGFSISLPASACFLCAVVFAYRHGLRMAGAKMADREQRMLDQLVRDRE